jgi:predicted enzyme related to lactoylglutathione lyase
VIFRVDDCRATYEELKSRGVEMVQEPIEQSYGTDAAFRDPTGNHIRFTQPAG